MPHSTLLEGRGAKAHEATGEDSQGRPVLEGTALHKRSMSAEEWEGAVTGRAAPILDGPGAEPPLPKRNLLPPQASLAGRSSGLRKGAKRDASRRRRRLQRTRSLKAPDREADAPEIVTYTR